MKAIQDKLPLLSSFPENSLSNPSQTNSDVHSETPLQQETKRTRNPKNLQDILWQESLQAVRISLDCESKNELISRLHAQLPQNSLVTRQRNTSTITSRFFPADGLDQLPRRILGTYSDEKLLASVMSVLLPMMEPVVGRLIAERLHPIPAGADLPANFFVKYGSEVDTKNAKKIASRCSKAAHVLGWTSRQGSKIHRLFRPVDLTAALLMLHSVHAPTPRIVELSHIISDPTWKYLGFADADELRSFFKALEAKRLIARYAQVDRLEQITSRYSLDELIEKRIRV